MKEYMFIIYIIFCIFALRLATEASISRQLLTNNKTTFIFLQDIKVDNARRSHAK